MKRFRGGLVFEAHRLCVSLNSRLESNKEEEDPEIGADLEQFKALAVWPMDYSHMGFSRNLF